jgi:hypothetical protein
MKKRANRTGGGGCDTRLPPLSPAARAGLNRLMTELGRLDKRDAPAMARCVIREYEHAKKTKRGVKKK